MNMYMTSSNFKNPTIAMMLARAPKKYISGIKNNNSRKTTIKLMRGMELYSWGIGELGFMVCLKKNFMGAIIPGLVIGGPTLCWIRAWINFRSMPGSKRLTMKDNVRVPNTAIKEYAIFMVTSPKSR
jgi:hypothetical protein